MKNKAPLAFLSAMSIFLSGLPVFAESTDFDVDSFYAETIGMFEDMKGSYTELANNYGNIGSADAEEVYMDYLQNIQQANENSNYDKKLELIKNTDLSVNDPVVSAAYKKAKNQVASSLAADGLDITGRPSNFSKDIDKQNKETYEFMASASEGAKRYQSIVQDFKNNGGNIKSYTGKDIQKSLSGSPLTASAQAKNSFKTTSTIYQMVNSGYEISEMGDEYGTETASEFASKARSNIEDFVKNLTEDGEPLTAKQQKEYEEAKKNLTNLDKAISDSNQGETAVQMSKVKDYLIRHKIKFGD